MRISDWSSDVCSSDLVEGAGGVARRHQRAHFYRFGPCVGHLDILKAAVPKRVGLHHFLELRPETVDVGRRIEIPQDAAQQLARLAGDRKSTRLNSSH